MDNHRAALWCWQQQVDLYATPHRILHIDRHSDALSANLLSHVNSMPDLRGLSIADYLDASVTLAGSNHPLFRWDNYLSIHIEVFKSTLSGLRFATHGDGDAPNYANKINSAPDELPENLEFWLTGEGPKWIVNVDLDYFFYKEADDNWELMFSEQFIDAVFSGISAARDKGHVSAITICLTPSNFTSGWEACLELSQRAFKLLGIDHPVI